MQRNIQRHFALLHFAQNKLLRFALKICYTLRYVIPTFCSERCFKMLNVITFCVNCINYNILRRNRHGKVESRPNLNAFRTRLFCLTPFIWNSAFITGSSLCLKISLKTFNNYSPVTLAHEQRFNHMSLNSKIKTYRLFNFPHQQLGLPVSLPDSRPVQV